MRLSDDIMFRAASEDFLAVDPLGIGSDELLVGGLVWFGYILSFYPICYSFIGMYTAVQ